MSLPLVRFSSLFLRSGNRLAPVLSSATVKPVPNMGNLLTGQNYGTGASTGDSQSQPLTDNEFRRMTDAEWRERLTGEQYNVCRQKGTEPPFAGEYVNNKQEGMYNCVACGSPLFESATKFDSGSGWPSFYQQYQGAGGQEEEGQYVLTKADRTLGMTRTEVLCAQCDSHLGHLFPDGPRPTGLRYCINSVSLKFVPAKDGGKM